EHVRLGVTPPRGKAVDSVALVELVRLTGPDVLRSVGAHLGLPGSHALHRSTTGRPSARPGARAGARAGSPGCTFAGRESTAMAAAGGGRPAVHQPRDGCERGPRVEPCEWDGHVYADPHGVAQGRGSRPGRGYGAGTGLMRQGDG